MSQTTPSAASVAAPVSADRTSSTSAGGVAAGDMGGGFARLPHHLIDGGVLNSLRPASLRVLLLMLRLADREGRCWPSQRAMASRTGTSVRSVQWAVTELIAAGLISRELESSNGQATMYRVNLSSKPPRRDADRRAIGDAQPAEAQDAARGGRNAVRDEAQSAAQTTRSSLRITKKQDQEPTTTTNPAARAPGDAASDVDGVDAVDAVDAGIDSRCPERARKAAADSDAAVDADPDSSSAHRCIARLAGLGITEQNAMRLLLSHSPAAIHSAAADAEFLAARKRVANPAGYVISALRRNDGPLPERLDIERREAKRRHHRERERHDAAAARQRASEDADQALRSEDEALRLMREMSDEARAAAVRDALAGQPSSVRAALEHRDARVSRNLAMLVRDHLDRAVAAHG